MQRRIDEEPAPKRAKAGAAVAAAATSAAVEVGVDESKGDATKRRILEHALHLAGVRGLDGLTIGELAVDLGLSKSGLFAHFKSKERLQLEVLEFAAEHFGRSVMVPALALPRGERRLRAIFENWLGWIRATERTGGCVFIAGAVEWDDREGPVRDALVHWFEQLHKMFLRAAQLCVDVGDFRADLDVPAFAYDLHGIALKYHLERRLLRTPKADERVRAAFERLLNRARA